jgi:hypothetical protein
MKLPAADPGQFSAGRRAEMDSILVEFAYLPFMFTKCKIGKEIYVKISPA